MFRFKTDWNYQLSIINTSYQKLPFGSGDDLVYKIENRSAFKRRRSSRCTLYSPLCTPTWYPFKKKKLVTNFTNTIMVLQMEHSTSALNERVLRTTQLAKLSFNHPSVVLTADVFQYFLLRIKTNTTQLRLSPKTCAKL